MTSLLDIDNEMAKKNPFCDDDGRHRHRLEFLELSYALAAKFKSMKERVGIRSHGVQIS